MPCYDGRDRDESTNRINELKAEANKWEAGFCAVISTLERCQTPENLQLILQEATTNSGMNVIALYHEHNKKDETRLVKELIRYSNDELTAIKNLIIKRNL